MEGLAAEVLAFLQGFTVAHAGAVAAVVTSILIGHGIGRAIGNLIIAFGNSIVARFPGAGNGAGG